MLAVLVAGLGGLGVILSLLISARVMWRWIMEGEPD